MTPPDVVILADGHKAHVQSAITRAFLILNTDLGNDDRWREKREQVGDPEELRSVVTHTHPTGRMVEVTSGEHDPHLQVGIDMGSGGWIAWVVSLPIADDVPRTPTHLVRHVLGVLEAIGRHAPGDDADARARLESWGRGACAHLDAATGRRTGYLIMPGINRDGPNVPTLIALDADTEDMDDPQIARLHAVAPTTVELLAKDTAIRLRHACYMRPDGIDADDPVGEIRALVDMRRLLGDAS
jgi:hypothetical protein